LKFLYKLSQITGEPLNLNDEIDQRMNTRHAVFVALGGGIGGIPPEEVVVKFTKRYNTAAHTKLAALGLAPKLYYHAAVRGGLFMVVMEKVVGSTAFRWLSLNGTTQLPLSVYTDVEAAVKELHEVDLVFGDLRLPNIMIRVEERDGNGNGGNAQGGDADTSPRDDRGSADSDSSVRALLIDFDWAAEDGVGRYPATISTSEEFSPAVDPYGLMHKAHDLYCLDLLRRRCK
jgi:serine/threonine protein kinase